MFSGAGGRQKLVSTLVSQPRAAVISWLPSTLLCTVTQDVAAQVTQPCWEQAEGCPDNSHVLELQPCPASRSSSCKQHCCTSAFGGRGGSVSRPIFTMLFFSIASLNATREWIFCDYGGITTRSNPCWKQGWPIHITPHIRAQANYQLLRADEQKNPMKLKLKLQQ